MLSNPPITFLGISILQKPTVLKLEVCTKLAINLFKSLSVHSSDYILFPFAWIEAYFLELNDNEYCRVNQYLLTKGEIVGEVAH